MTEAKGGFGRYLKSYVIKVAIWFVLLNAAAAIASRISAERVQSFNQSVVANVANWRPTQLARVYYGELLNGGLFSVPLLRTVKRIAPLFFGVAAMNIPFAVVSTAKRYVLDGGTAQPPTFTLPDDWTRVEIPTVDSRAPVPDAPPNPVIGLIGFALGVLTVLVYFRYRGGIGGFGYWAAIFLLSPLVGSVIMWIIGIAMMLAGVLLGGILSAAKSVTAFAASIPLLANLMAAMIKPIESGVEDHVVSSITDRMN